jgi:predicted PurR-regulated permease PerM
MYAVFEYWGMRMKKEDLKTGGPSTAKPGEDVLNAAASSGYDLSRGILLTLLLIIVAALLAAVILSLSYLFFLLAVSVFVAYFLSPIVSLLRGPFRGTRFDRVMPRWLAIIIAYLFVFTIAGTGITYLAPQVVEQGQEFGTNMPAYAESIRRSYNDMNRRFDRLRIPEEMQTTINDQAVVFGQSITAACGGFIINTARYLPFLVIVPIFSFFFLKDAEFIRSAILRVFPPGRLRRRADSVLEDVSTTLAAYTRAQVFSCLLIGAICTVGFSLIGLRYALLLGILAGIFEFVPLLGPLAIGVIATSVGAFGENPRRGLYTLVFLIVLRVFHDYVTYPRIVHGGLRLHPLLIILSVIAGEQIAGIPGVFVAIPIVAIFAVIYRHVLAHHSANDLETGFDARPSLSEGENT